MNAALCNKGLGFPNGPLCAKWGIKRLYFPMNDPQITQKWMDEVRGSGLEVGIMRAVGEDSWGGWLTPKEYAKRISDDLVRVASPSYYANGGPVQCAVMMDNESKDMNYVLQCIIEFRKLRNMRELQWTLEGHQGANVAANPDLVAKVNQTVSGVTPQSYNYQGATSEDWDEAAMVRDVVLAGISPAKVFPFLGLRNRKPAPWWEGVLFLESWEMLQ